MTVRRCRRANLPAGEPVGYNPEVANRYHARGVFPMAARKKPEIRILKINKGDSLKTIYRKAREAFTAADLQKYTEIEEGIPMEQVLAELEAIQNAGAPKGRKEKKKG
jgi:hypothetical protein